MRNVTHAGELLSTADAAREYPRQERRRRRLLRDGRTVGDEHQEGRAHAEQDGQHRVKPRHGQAARLHQIDEQLSNDAA
jgi:hypothetical protein